jgi:hypothetical protein
MDVHYLFVTCARSVMSQLVGIRADVIRGYGRAIHVATAHHRSDTVEGIDQLMRDIRACRIEEVNITERSG